MPNEYSDYKDAVEKRLPVSNAKLRENINRQLEIRNLLL